MTQKFRFINLETLTVLAYPLQTLSLSPYEFGDPNSPGLFL